MRGLGHSSQRVRGPGGSSQRGAWRRQPESRGAEELSHRVRVFWGAMPTGYFDVPFAPTQKVVPSRCKTAFGQISAVEGWALAQTGKGGLWRGTLSS